jgi:hypothetical protein
MFKAYCARCVDNSSIILTVWIISDSYEFVRDALKSNSLKILSVVKFELNLVPGSIYQLHRRKNAFIYFSSGPQKNKWIHI